MKEKNWRSFEEAREFVRALKLKNQKDWWAWTKTADRPEDIPTNPHKDYKNNGWINLGDWLGTGTIACRDKVYRTFEEAKVFAHSLNLHNKKEWDNWIKLGNCPDDIPMAPHLTYKKEGWQSWGDWLGTETVASFNKKFRDFESARTFARDLKLSGKDEWFEWIKNGNRPDDIPTNPANTYGKTQEWTNWGDWLGTFTMATKEREYLSFEKARTFIRTLGLTSRAQWEMWKDSNTYRQDIPKAPGLTYVEWTDWGDWLGTDTIATGKRVYRDFDEARIFARSLNLKVQTEWRNWIKLEIKPDDIPSAPDLIYKNKGWIDWADWLRAGESLVNPNFRNFRPFEEARDFARQLNLKSLSEWREWAKSGAKPYDIPATPETRYKNEVG